MHKDQISQTATSLIHFDRDTPVLEILRLCGGVYLCPKDAAGKRVGPLVGYAGKSPRLKTNLVGDIYANFSTAERYWHVMAEFARRLVENPRFQEILPRLDGLCGMPMGGITYSSHLARACDRTGIFLEKLVTAVANPIEGTKEESILVAGRCEIILGANYAIVEDVTNNFSTTLKAIGLIEKAGGKVIAICSILNRSPKHTSDFPLPDGREIPVISAYQEPFPEFETDDEAVAADIAAGNVIWKPKENWPKLMTAMDAARETALANQSDKPSGS
ncbi:MAG: hypothetical protein PHS53_02065 [Candidatus Pacebacteria bacterium]|nr:hypothetical protein [Candidatus Paceibacterota bacterium]MDD5356910.1 hypothetical protein [Candidatus Paceibacterota bacterium]